MKPFFRDYLTFNKRERNGLFVLLVIITLLIVYLNTSNSFTQPEIADFTKSEQTIELFNASLQHENEAGKPESGNKFKPGTFKKASATKSSERFNFNPNNLPVEDWKRLGFSDKQIHIIKNYESKGGTFRTKEDVKKMYGIPEKLYTSLEPYISIPVEEKVVYKRDTTAKYTAITVELNTADSVQLTTIKGVGAFYAKAIIKYRNLLGGFIAKEQLLEMWKFDSLKLEGIKKYITIDISKIKKININSGSAEHLKHPYINWNKANAIFNYRLKHGNYSNIDDIKKTDLVDEETYRKIAPYLITE